MSIHVLDPTFGEVRSTTARVPRLRSLAGCTVGLLDNSKIKVRELLDHMEDILRSEHGVANVLRLKKPDASRPVPEEVVAEMRACEAIISAVGD